MSPVQADFGLRAVNGNLMFNADMMVGGGEYGTSSVGGKVGVKYDLLIAATFNLSKG